MIKIVTVLKYGFSVLLFGKTMAKRKEKWIALKNELAVIFYGKTKKEEDALFKSFNGMIEGDRKSLRRFYWLPRFF